MDIHLRYRHSSSLKEIIPIKERDPNWGQDLSLANPSKLLLPSEGLEFNTNDSIGIPKVFIAYTLIFNDLVCNYF